MVYISITIWIWRIILTKQLLNYTRHAIQLHWCFTISSTLAPSKQLFCLFSLYNETGIIWRDKVFNSKKIFTLQKKIVKITFCAKPGNSGRSLLGKWPTWCKIPFYVFIFLFVTLYMFQAHCAHHQERRIVSIQPLVTVTLKIGE